MPDRQLAVRKFRSDCIDNNDTSTMNDKDIQMHNNQSHHTKIKHRLFVH